MPGSADDPVILDPFQLIRNVGFSKITIFADCGSVGNSGFAPSPTANSGNLTIDNNANPSLPVFSAGGLNSGGGEDSEVYVSDGSFPGPPGPPNSYNAIEFMIQNLSGRYVELESHQTSGIVGPHSAFANLGLLVAMNPGLLAAPTTGGILRISASATPGNGSPSGSGACRIGFQIYRGTGNIFTFDSGITPSPLSYELSYDLATGDFSVA